MYDTNECGLPVFICIHSLLNWRDSKEHQTLCNRVCKMIILRAVLSETCQKNKTYCSIKDAAPNHFPPHWLSVKTGGFWLHKRELRQNIFQEFSLTQLSQSYSPMIEWFYPLCSLDLCQGHLRGEYEDFSQWRQKIGKGSKFKVECTPQTRTVDVR